MKFEEAIKTKFGKTTIVTPLPNDGYFVVLDQKKLQLGNMTIRRELSKKIKLVPGACKNEAYLYGIDDPEPFAVIISEEDHDYFIIYKCTKNRELLKEMQTLV